MGKPSKSISSQLAKLTKICLALPNVLRKDQGDHTAFIAGKKTIAYFLNNHHGDGIVGVACKVLPGDNQRLIAAHPERFYMPAYVGPRGWVAVRLDLKKVDWEEVAELIATSYQLIAPKRLAALIEAAID
ncbi:MAG TPA: MmcQ/YjbR family DNA-binding protein [Blastocatellia bacterium]|nr:MmcQ/YjbR family DNA-binding protein [Blastocatellia bacterium]